MTCPSCGAGMDTEALESHAGASVEINLCRPCQQFWFDTHESLQLSPAAVLNLFRLIGEQALAAHPRAPGRPACPRCGLRLLLTHDQQRATKFQYLRCGKKHGRLITFVDFLREKDFIKPLSALQVKELRRHVQTINCSNCGAPIDLAKRSSCGHCASPLSMLDLKQAGAVVAALRESAQSRPIDPALPLELERARREVEAAFEAFERKPGWFDDVAQGGLVAAGLSSLARWLKQRQV